MSARPNITDVAKASGYSTTTVSHALSGARSVKEATALHIRAVANQLGYVPSRSASSLRSGRTGTIGLLSPAVGGKPATDELLGLEFYMRLAAEVARRALVHEQTVILLPHVHDPGWFRHAELDGALLFDPEEGDPVLAALRAASVPVVTLEQDPDRPENPWHVRADHTASTEEVLDHFASQGSTQPALLLPDLSWAWVTQVKAAYCTWCAQQGITPLIALVSPDDPRFGAERAAKRLLSGPTRPDAIYALAERYGPAVLAAAGDLALEVPVELLVASGVDSAQAQSAGPPLTAVALEPERQGAAAVDLLLGLVNGEGGGPVVVPAGLCVRGSTLRFLR